jgi:hypothetical protein
MPAIRQILPLANPIVLSTGVTAGDGDTQTFNYFTVAPQYDGIFVLALLGTITSTGVATLRARGSNTTTFSTSGTVNCFTDADSGSIIEAVGTNATGNDSGTLLVLDITRIGTIYARAEMARATANIVITSVVGMTYDSKYGPVTTYTGVASSDALPGYAINANPALSAT